MIATLLALIAAAFLVAPLFVVVPLSFSSTSSFAFPPSGYSLQYYQAFIHSDDWLSVVLNSVLIATATTVITMCIAIPAAFSFVRYRFRGASVVNLLIMSPLVTPHIMVALADYKSLASAGLLGSYTGVVLAHTVLTIPICFLSASAALRGFNVSLERAAMSMGAGPITTFRLITFPALRPGLLVGALFTFLYSFQEPVVSLFISGRNAATMPKKMFESIQSEADPVIAVVSTLLVGSALCAIAIPAAFRGLSKRKH